MTSTTTGRTPEPESAVQGRHGRTRSRGSSDVPMHEHSDPAREHSYLGIPDASFPGADMHSLHSGATVTCPAKVTGTTCFPGEVVPLRWSNLDPRAERTAMRSYLQTSRTPLLLLVTYSLSRAGRAEMFNTGVLCEVRDAWGIRPDAPAEVDVSVRVAVLARVRLLQLRTGDALHVGTATMLHDVELGSPPHSLTAASLPARRLWRSVDVHHVAERAWALGRSSGIITVAHEDEASAAWCRAHAAAAEAGDARSGDSSPQPALQQHDGAVIIHTMVDDPATAASRAAFRPRSLWQAMARDAAGFSWWLARNLPLSSSQKQWMLQENSVLRRLQRQVTLMQRAAVMVCAACSNEITSCSAVLAMSRTGVMTVFVNPHGLVSRILTTHSVMRGAVDVRSVPDLADSWYPGYGWSIIDCARCDNHVGWRYDWAPNIADIVADIEWDATRGEFVVLLDADEAHSTASSEDAASSEQDDEPPAATTQRAAPTVVQAPEGQPTRGILRHLMSLLQNANMTGGEIGVGLQRFAGVSAAAGVHRRPLRELVNQPPPAEQPHVFYGLRQGAVVPRYAAALAPADDD